MAEIIYLCCAVISTVCTILLVRSYMNAPGRILLWVAICFGFLALNNVFSYIDLILLPDINLLGGIVRNSLLAIAGLILIVGLVWEIS